MENRRLRPRIGISFPVEYRSALSKDFYYTVSKDLSEGGTKIIGNEFLRKKEELLLNINLINRVLNLKAQVRWCLKEKSGQRYSTGLEFIGLTDSDRKELAGFLTKITNS